MSAQQRITWPQLAIGLAALVGLGFWYVRSLSPSISGSLTVGTTTLEAERCSGFATGVEVFLAGDHYDAITAGVRPDGSLRVMYNGEEVTECTEATLEYGEGRIVRVVYGIEQPPGPEGPRPVIGGRLRLNCNHNGTPLRGNFEFARCRQS